MGISCPICGKNCSDRGHARRHLHVDHRKSEVLEMLLEQTTPEPEQREPVAVIG